MPKRRLFFVSCLVLLLAYAAYHENVQRYLVPASAFDNPFDAAYGPVEVAELPWGKASCCMVTVDDVSYHSSTTDLLSLVGTVHDLGVHATLFVIPAHGSEEKSVQSNPALVSVLQTAQYAGCEVAQHGYTHTPPTELRGMSLDEQMGAILRGREILESCFGEISGFRPPSFWANTDTYKTLDAYGYEYCASASIFNVYPYYPPGHVYPLWGTPLHVLIIPTFPEDDLWMISSDDIDQSIYQLSARWGSCRNKGTPYVLTTHLAPLMLRDGADVPGLTALSEFITTIDDGSVWFPSMSEYAEWYEMRTNIDISYEIEENMLYILINSDNDVSGLTLSLSEVDDVTDVTVLVNGDVAFNGRYEDMASMPLIIS